MNKSILLSIRPEWVEKILNGKKTIEVRKVFPKNYVGYIYIYCTKGKLIKFFKGEERFGNVTGLKEWDKIFEENDLNDIDGINYAGKVVARFWCDKVEEMVNPYFPKGTFATRTISYEKLLEYSCLNEKELNNYIPQGKYGYAIHISKLEIFDTPRELSEFGIKRAPQNYCYIEGEEGWEK